MTRLIAKYPVRLALNPFASTVGNILLMVSILTVIGTFPSDLVLLWIDPRIRVGAR